MSNAKTDLSRAGTMKVTAKEGEAVVDQKPDDDAHTEKGPAAKKAKMTKGRTMAETAEEGKALLAGETVADTRQQTQVTKKTKAAKPSSKKSDSITRTMEEAKAVYGDIKMTEGRSLRKRPEAARPPPPVKKARTMQKTAKEGKQFVKKANAKKAAAEKKVEEKKEDEEKADAKA